MTIAPLNTKSSAMKFPHNPKFNPQFDQIADLVWYPYVGQHFEQYPQKLMVFAHNAYMDHATYELRKADFEQKSVWVDSLEEYTYERGWWTKAFRCFIKGAVGLTENYGDGSDSAVTDKVDTFVNRIAYLNFIQGLVQSEKALTMADAERVERSKAINRQILKTLGITHCICWGKPVFEYVSTSEGVSIIDSEDLGQKGFGYHLIQDGQGRRMHVLKVFHPSMPFGYRPRSVETQRIIANFLSKPNP